MNVGRQFKLKEVSTFTDGKTPDTVISTDTVLTVKESKIILNELEDEILKIYKFEFENCICEVQIDKVVFINDTIKDKFIRLAYSLLGV